MARVDGWLKNAQRVLLGPRCVLCSGPAPLERALCAGCLADLPWLDHACRHCALALPPNTSVTICPGCQRRPRFDAAIAAFAYREPLRWLIGGLKFQARLAHARLLGDLLASRVERAPRPQALVPVPLYRAGFRRRGFNQAERIARRVSQALDLPLAGALVTRTRDTAPQSTLAASARAANVRGAFACASVLPYRHVAIVDDVVTTTGTAAAVAVALKRAGAQRVDLYCVARA
jgi:ComF family protein